MFRKFCYKSEHSLVIQEVCLVINYVLLLITLIMKWSIGPVDKKWDKICSNSKGCVVCLLSMVCGLPPFHGAIDGTHIAIVKPKEYPKEFYYYKTGKYSFCWYSVLCSHNLLVLLQLPCPQAALDQAFQCFQACSSLGDECKVLLQRLEHLKPAL